MIADEEHHDDGAAAWRALDEPLAAGGAAGDLHRPAMAPAHDPTGPAVAAVSAFGAPLILALTLALAAWGGFGVTTHLLDPHHWRVDEARTERAVARALASLAAPAGAPTRLRYAAWSREVLESVRAQGDGPDLALAEAWLAAGPLVVGDNAFAARGALALGAPPPFPGALTRAERAAVSERLKAVDAAQVEAARGRFARRELAHLSKTARARYAAAGGEARARGFVPGADTGQIDAVRLRAAPSRAQRAAFGGLSREIALYGDIRDLTVFGCAHARARAEGGAAPPGLCRHPDLPDAEADRGALALAAVSAALSHGEAADEEDGAVLRAGVALVSGALRQGVTAGLEADLRAQAQMAVRFSVLERELAAAFAPERARANPAQIPEAAAAAARASLVSAQADPLRPVLMAVGAAATAASRDTALRVLMTAESAMALRRAAGAAATAGPAALALRARRDGDLAGLTRWRLRSDLAFARDLAVLGLSAVFAALAARPAWRALRRRARDRRGADRGGADHHGEDPRARPHAAPAA